MIQAKFALNWSSGFRGEDFWKRLDGQRTPSDANSSHRWAKKSRRKSRKKIFWVATFSNPQTVGRVRETKKF